MRMRPLRSFTLLGLAIASTSFAQSPAPPAPAAQSAATVGFMHAIHATRDVATTLAFYTDVFGIAGEVRPFENPGVPLLTNSPGVTLRVSMLQIPGRGFNFELTQFSNVERRSAQPDVVDPGAPHMKIFVRDLDPVVAAITKIGATVVTRTGAPVRVSMRPFGTVEAIMFRDPDGYLVEAVKAPPPPDAGPGNVLGAIMGVTVADLDQSLEFWHGLLGFELEGDPAFASDAPTLDLFGLKPDVSYRIAEGMVPGSQARIQLIEFHGTSGRPFDLRVPDPGASGMAIRVAAIDKLLPKLKKAGVRVLSKDGKLVEWSPTIRNVFVKDPNGLNIELVGAISPPPRKPAAAPAKPAAPADQPTAAPDKPGPPTEQPAAAANKSAAPPDPAAPPDRPAATN
jgi:catechol 2,3-dioxygenase-like lactoylglutathione lyase family enzyme